MTEKDDFLDGVMPVEPEAMPEPQAAPAPEPAPEPQAVPPAVPVEPEPAPKPEPGHIPITALLDEREKRKELERRLAELEKDRTQAAPIPDPSVDPYGYQQALMQQVQQQVLDTRLNMSETAARRHYGDDVTEKAKDWALSKFGTNPAFQAEVLNSPDPYDYAIKAFQRDQIASQVTADDFAAFQAWKTAQAQIATAPAPAPVPPPAPVPRSIASTPSAGGMAHEPVDPESGYASAIPG